MNREDKFLAWEAQSRDLFTVQRHYCQIAGELPAGAMLSQIVYWFLPSKNGNDKTRITFDGRRWIAKAAASWLDECFLTPDQARRCLKLLSDKGLIVTVVKKFNGEPTTHISLNTDALIAAKAAIEIPVVDCEPSVPGPVGSGSKPKSITETTAGTKSKTSLGKTTGKDLLGDDVQASVTSLSKATTDAVETYNASPLTKKNGGALAAVTLINDVRQYQVKRCIDVATAICESVYKTKELTREFWEDYWASVDNDDWAAGRGNYTGKHANWRPDFEYLTRADVMDRIANKALGE